MVPMVAFNQAATLDPSRCFYFVEWTPEQLDAMAQQAMMMDCLVITLLVLGTLLVIGSLVQLVRRENHITRELINNQMKSARRYITTQPARAF